MYLLMISLIRVTIEAATTSLEEQEQEQEQEQAEGALIRSSALSAGAWVIREQSVLIYIQMDAE